MEKVFIIGSSGHAQVIIDMIRMESKYSIQGLFDDFIQIEEYRYSLPILGGVSAISAPQYAANSISLVVAIGDNHQRHLVVKKIADLNASCQYPPVIHPKATLSPNSSVGNGTVIMAGAIINPGACIGSHCIINTNSVIEHDVKIGDFSSIGPSATIAGGCSIGNETAICAGATVIEKIEIGDFTVIGAGSVVTRNITSQVIAFGSPARPVKARDPSSKYLK